MIASSDDPPLHPGSSEALDRASQEVVIAIEVATQRINRLLATAFEDKFRAEVALKGCLRGIGVSGTLNILAGQGLLPRNHYFGFTRGSFFARGDRERTKLALAELPEAIQDREVLSHKLDDLMNTRRVLLEQAATRNPRVPDPGRGDNGGGRRRIR